MQNIFICAHLKYHNLHNKVQKSSKFSSQYKYIKSLKLSENISSRWKCLRYINFVKLKRVTCIPWRTCVAVKAASIKKIGVTSQPCFKWLSASHDNWCTETLLNRVITAQWEGMGDVRVARYEPALLPPYPTIRVLSYSNYQRSTHSSSRAQQFKQSSIR